MLNYLVEFIGTLVFMYIIIGTGNPLLIGLTLTACIMAGGAISGGNFNPAGSVMMAMAGKLPMTDLLPYVAAQILGALVALHLYKRFGFIKL